MGSGPGREDSMHAHDSFDLKRFLQAQENTYDRALAELRAGRKTSHWIWYVFPQIDGLGRSPAARHYAIKSLAEARAYLAHPVLGARLRECTRAMLALQGLTAHEILGDPDDLKFCSSMTLFEHAAEDNDLFGRAIDTYFAGRRDAMTLMILGADGL
jgi:uncharacterized protein (DUF1810 family)